LKELVVCEDAILLAQKTVDRHKSARNLAVALAVEKLIPCILHMKTRLGEKILHVIVNSALERYKDSKIDATRRNEMVSELEQCMRTKVFGSSNMNRLTQWSFRWDDGNRRMAKYNMSGVLAGKVMKHLHFIAYTLFQSKLDEDAQSEEHAQHIRSQNMRLCTKWKEISKNLKVMWTFIEQHND
jgi:hypothetical protein